jgi:glycosyltransferase involved in cell wall biosynthesis
MNIAIFASAFHPHFGGVEEACRNLALEYIRRGHRVHVITTRHPKELAEFEIIQGIPVHRFPFEMPNSSPLGMINFLKQFPSDLLSVLRTLSRNRIDIIHVQCIGPNGLYALAAKYLTNLPLVVTTQGERTMDAGHIYESSATMNWTMRNLFQCADFITACSQQTLDDAEEFAGFSFKHKSRTVYNGVSLTEFDIVQESYNHPKPYLLGIGRVVKQKGFDILIDAYSKIAKEISDLPDLIIAGDGSERESLQQQIESINLANQIHLIGRADRQLAVKLFKGCECFVLPSRHEPQGIVSLEAMACSKPVIAARVGGVPEIVLENEIGLLFNGSDSDSLAEALKSLLSDPKKAQELGQAGRKRVEEHFTWQVIADQYSEIYKNISKPNFNLSGAIWKT